MSESERARSDGNGVEVEGTIEYFEERPVVMLRYDPISGTVMGPSGDIPRGETGA